MNRAGIFKMALLAVALLAACQKPRATPIFIAPNKPSATPTLAAPGEPGATPTAIIPNEPGDEAEIQLVVEGFGKQLQLVSLQSPDAAQAMEAHYSEFVSPTLLQMWKRNGSNAPGRMVSSPWPDRIEITRFGEESPDRYAVAGFVVEITSLEVVGGGAPARIPVRMIVEKTQGHWMITEYAEER